MNIFDSFDKGWQYAKKHGLVLSLILFACFLLVYWLTYKCFPDAFWVEYVKIAEKNYDFPTLMAKMEKLNPYIEEAFTKIWLVSILQWLFVYGVINMALSVVIGETRNVNFKYMSLPFLTYLKVIENLCIFYLIALISPYLFGLPIIFFGVRMMFVIPILLEYPKCSFLLAVKQSWQMTKGTFLTCLGFWLISFLVLLIGVIFFFVGLFLASSIVIFAYLDFYKQAMARCTDSIPNS